MQARPPLLCRAAHLAPLSPPGLPMARKPLRNWSYKDHCVCMLDRVTSICCFSLHVFYVVVVHPRLWSFWAMYLHCTACFPFLDICISSYVTPPEHSLNQVSLLSLISFLLLDPVYGDIFLHHVDC